MPDGLSVLGFAPAMKIIGRTIGKIFNSFYTVLAEGDEHSRSWVRILAALVALSRTNLFLLGNTAN